MDPLGGREPLTRVLFGENDCENERIGSHRGRAPDTPPRSANGSSSVYISQGSKAGNEMPDEEIYTLN